MLESVVMKKIISLLISVLISSGILFVLATLIVRDNFPYLLYTVPLLALLTWWIFLRISVLIKGKVAGLSMSVIIAVIVVWCLGILMVEDNLSDAVFSFPLWILLTWWLYFRIVNFRKKMV
jgi:hypothetical protein